MRISWLIVAAFLFAGCAKRVATPIIAPSPFAPSHEGSVTALCTVYDSSTGWTQACE